MGRKISSKCEIEEDISSYMFRNDNKKDRYDYKFCKYEKDKERKEKIKKTRNFNKKISR